MRFGGDVLLGGYYEIAAGESLSLAFSRFTLMADADIAMVNLENPVTTRGKKVPKPYNFRMHPGFLRTITDAGIDLVTIANNHVFDYGREGFFDTISYLDSAGIRHVGAGVDRDEAHKPVVMQVRGKRIGFLAYYGGREAPGAGKFSPGVARREPGRVTADILNLKNILRADYVVVNLHWGTEKADTPDLSQQAFARALIDAGADAVIGHHPHVLQGIEAYRSGVIVYSLGNFVFGGNSRDTYNTGVFEICLAADGPSYRFIPVGVREWSAEVLAGADSARVMDTMRRLSKKFTSTIPYNKESQ
jgi:poly-gamma-glutamate synthesis protein (capsule biosynthesis protein)